MVEWQGCSVLVTGAAGIVGSWLTKDLVDRGAAVTILLRDEVPSSELVLSGYISKVTVVRGGLENYEVVERALNEYEIEVVFHLGAQAIVQTAQRNPLSTYESNIKGTWNILEAARKHPLLKAFILASSDKAYGTHATLPYKEDFALRGMHPYDVSKTCADLLAQTYSNAYGLPMAIARCGNIYGGGDLNFNRIVPGTIRSLLQSKVPEIRSDGTHIREYIYVKDVVDSYRMLAEKIDEDSVKGEAFNFGTEEPITVLDISKKIISVMGKEVEPKILNVAKGEIKEQTLRCEKARRVLGWKPTHSFEKGMQETIDWYTAFFKQS